MKRNKKYKGIANVLVKKEFNIIIQQYIEVVSKVYQGFLYLIFNYIYYKKKEQGKVKNEEVVEGGKLNNDEKKILESIKTTYQGDDTPWNRFYTKELEDQDNYSLRWLATNKPKLYYESLCTIGSMGKVDTTERFEFGKRKLAVLFVCTYLIKKNEDLIDIVGSTSCGHLKKMKDPSNIKTDLIGEKEKENKIIIPTNVDNNLKKIIENINIIIKENLTQNSS